MLMDNVTGWIRKLTEAGVSLIALAIVIQVLFTNTAFLPGDVIARLTTIIGDLGSAGLVGLVAAALLYKIFTR